MVGRDVFFFQKNLVYLMFGYVIINIDRWWREWDPDGRKMGIKIVVNKDDKCSLQR